MVASTTDSPMAGTRISTGIGLCFRPFLGWGLRRGVQSRHLPRARAVLAMRAVAMGGWHRGGRRHALVSLMDDVRLLHVVAGLRAFGRAGGLGASDVAQFDTGGQP